MFIYGINILFTVVWWCLIKNNFSKNKEKIYCSIVMIQLMFLALFRSINVGGDLKGYKDWFYIILDTSILHMDTLKNVPHYEGMDIGWNWLNKILSMLYPDFRIVIFFSSIIFIGTVTWFIFKYSKIKWFSFFLFLTLGYYTQAFSALRQYIAISIVLISLKYAYERKAFRFFFLIALASTFHLSAICCFIIYFFPKIKLNRYYWLLIILCMLSLIIFSSEWLFILISKTKYVNYYTQGLGKGSGDGMLVMFSCFLFLILIYLKKYQRTDTRIKIYFSMYIVSMLLNILALNLGYIGRVMLYFHIILIVLLPNLVYSIDGRNSKNISIIVISSMTILYYFGFVLRTDNIGVVPYQLIGF